MTFLDLLNQTIQGDAQASATEQGPTPATDAQGTAPAETAADLSHTPTPQSPTDIDKLTQTVGDLMDTVKQQQATIEQQQATIEQQQAEFQRQLADYVQYGIVSTGGTGADQSAETQPVQQQPESTGYVPLRNLDFASSYLKRGK